MNMPLWSYPNDVGNVGPLVRLIWMTHKGLKGLSIFSIECHYQQCSLCLIDHHPHLSPPPLRGRI